MKKDILIVIMAFEMFLIALAILDLNIRINELKRDNEIVHEYILNRIGG